MDCRVYYGATIGENGRTLPLPLNNKETLKNTELKGDQEGRGVVKGGTFIENLYGDKIIEFYEGGRQQSVRMGNWKAYRKNGTKGKLELYDLSKDIGETKDLAEQHPELVKRMEQIMAEEHSPSPVWSLPGLSG